MPGPTPPGAPWPLRAKSSARARGIGRYRNASAPRTRISWWGAAPGNRPDWAGARAASSPTRRCTGSTRKPEAMMLLSIHPGNTLVDIASTPGIRPVVPTRIPSTEPPSSEQFRLTRGGIDPARMYMGQRTGQLVPTSRPTDTRPRSRPTARRRAKACAVEGQKGPPKRCAGFRSLPRTGFRSLPCAGFRSPSATPPRRKGQIPAAETGHPSTNRLE